MSNSLLVFTLLVQEGLNASTQRWRKIVFDFVDEASQTLEHWSPSYRMTLHKIAQYWPQNILCESTAEAR